VERRACRRYDSVTRVLLTVRRSDLYMASTVAVLRGVPEMVAGLGCRQTVHDLTYLSRLVQGAARPRVRIAVRIKLGQDQRQVTEHGVR